MNGNDIRSAAVLSVLAVCLSACLYPDGFRKDAGPPTSLTVTRIGDDAFRIDLPEIAGTTRQGVISNLLRKAAAVTREAGCDYFIVIGGEVLGDNEMQSTPFAGSYPESPSGSLAEGTARLSQRYSGSVLFRVHRGEVPPDNPLAFDARALSR